MPDHNLTWVALTRWGSVAGAAVFAVFALPIALFVVALIAAPTLGLVAVCAWEWAERWTARGKEVPRA